MTPSRSHADGEPGDPCVHGARTAGALSAIRERLRSAGEGASVGRVDTRLQHLITNPTHVSRATCIASGSPQPSHADGAFPTESLQIVNDIDSRAIRIPTNRRENERQREQGTALSRSCSGVPGHDAVYDRRRCPGKVSHHWPALLGQGGGRTGACENGSYPQRRTIKRHLHLSPGRANRNPGFLAQVRHGCLRGWGVCGGQFLPATCEMTSPSLTITGRPSSSHEYIRSHHPSRRFRMTLCGGSDRKPGRIFSHS